MTIKEALSFLTPEVREKIAPLFSSVLSREAHETWPVSTLLGEVPWAHTSEGWEYWSGLFCEWRQLENDAALRNFKHFRVQFYPGEHEGSACYVDCGATLVEGRAVIQLLRLNGQPVAWDTLPEYVRERIECKARALTPCDPAWNLEYEPELY